MTVLDYSNPAAISGEFAQEQSLEGVLRYLSDFAGKRLTAAEAQDLWDHGIPIGVVWENYGDDDAGGYSYGYSFGQRARAQATALGFPPDWPIYCAVDRRLTAATRPTAVEYQRGFHDGSGRSRPYGEGALIDACVEAGFTDLGWMPETWGPCANLALVQLVYAANPYPATDLNTVVHAAWGGYHPTPTPAPSPGDDDMATPLTAAEAKRTLVVRWYQAIANRKPHQIDADGFAYWVGRLPDDATTEQIAAVEADFRGAVAFAKG